MLRSSSRNAASSGVSASCMAASCRFGVNVTTPRAELICGDAGRSLDLHLDPSRAGPVHSLGLMNRSARQRRWPGGCDGWRAYGRPMRTEFPGERLQRRLRAEPDTDALAEPEGTGAASNEDPPNDDQNSLLPRWLPDSSQNGGWVAKVRADPGRAGAIGLAIVAALAVLVTVFTLVRDRSAPVMSAKLPPVEKVSTASPRSSASPTAEPDHPVVVSVVGLVHTPGLVTLPPGARIADALQAAGGAVNGAD